jgi:hypothetical protein
MSLEPMTIAAEKLSNRARAALDPYLTFFFELNYSKHK